MALYDNKRWILSNTRNAFVSSDDTGMCEVVMASDNLLKQLPSGKYDCYWDEQDDDDDGGLAPSFEIHTDLRYGLVTNTSQRLKMMAEAKKKSAETLHIKWCTNPVPLTDEEKAELFPKKDIEEIRESNKNKSRRSLLTEMLAKHPSLPMNPFQIYAKFDGNAQLGVATKKIAIFITMLPEEERNYPMRVDVIATAKIIDFIGLICWRCSNEYPNIQLKSSAKHYGLFIAEEDGEVDWDFPCLDPKENVSKFGFNFLALVEKELSSTPEDSPPNNTLEDAVTPKENPPLSKRAQQQLEEEARRMKMHTSAIEAPLFQDYKVCLVNTFKVRQDVKLGISVEKLEVEPLLDHHSSVRLLTRKLRILSHPMSSIAACDLIEHKSNNRALFRVVYYQKRLGEEGGVFKHHTFEADASVASDVTDKVNNILDVLQSEARKEYIYLRERKAHRRRTFHLGPR